MDTQAAVPQQLTEQESIRREKLRKLRQAGQDPYAITRYDRTHESTDILNGFDELERHVLRFWSRMQEGKRYGAEYGRRKKASPSPSSTAARRLPPSSVFLLGGHALFVCSGFYANRWRFESFLHHEGVASWPFLLP